MPFEDIPPHDFKLKKLKYETGIEPDLNEVEIKKYVSEVISEIRK